MRTLWQLKYDWDTPRCEKLREEWTLFFQDMLEIAKLKFSRCIKPLKATKNPILVIFSDASGHAFGACAYVRWELQNGTFKSALFTSKTRVSPLTTETIVILELAAAVLSKCLRRSIIDHSRLKFEKIFHIIDSEIVRAMINKDSYGFNTFVATRVGEIQGSIDPSEWFWIKSELNIADILTKGSSPDKLDATSEWQCGPEFLTLSIENGS